MATREEKLKIIDNLRTQIDTIRKRIEQLLEMRRLREEQRKRRFRAGTLFRTGILLLLVAIGLGVAAYFL